LHGTIGASFLPHPFEHILGHTICTSWIRQGVQSHAVDQPALAVVELAETTLL
jgi:hypothetical protein